MENLLLSLSVVFPLCAMMALGYGIKRINLVNEVTVKQMNNLTFRVFLPLLLFYNVYSTDLSDALRPKLMAFAVGAVFCTFLLALLIVFLLEKDNPKRGAIAQAIFRSNFVIFGIPVTESLFGKAGLGVAALLIAVVVPTFNILAVVALELFRGQKINFLKIVKGVLTNPLILASLLALILLFAGIRIPTVLEDVISDLARVATPLALVILGASFTFSDTKNYRKQLVIGLAGKLLMMPGIFLVLAILFGFRQLELAILLTVLGSPTAVSSFTMAQQMDADGTLAGQLVVYSSILSIFTMFLWIFTLKQTGLI